MANFYGLKPHVKWGNKAGDDDRCNNCFVIIFDETGVMRDDQIWSLIEMRETDDGCELDS